ncbi:retrotransposon protein, putative, ty1-copia subclass [Tanacetum coccineum]
MVRSKMIFITLSLSFWDYALKFAIRILNMVPTKKVDKTPYELLYGKVPKLSYLKFWGCEALVKHDTPDKLQQRSIKCIFLGHPKENNGGRAIEFEEIQDEDTSPSGNTSKILVEVEDFEPPQKDEAHVHRFGILLVAQCYECGDAICSTPKMRNIFGSWVKGVPRHHTRL